MSQIPPAGAALPDLLRVTATLLGTGTSTGVPIVGCPCAVCTSPDPRDARLRTSAHVVAHTAAGPVHVQIDTGPDFRTQALRANLEVVDALVVTHHHFDHVVGLDDLRPFFFRVPRPVPVHTSPASAAVLRQMFGYVFDRTYPGASLLDLAEVGGPADAPEPFVVRSRTRPGAAVRVVPLAGMHGRLPVLGVRVGALAYLTDVNGLPEETFRRLAGVDVLVLDGLRPEPHPTHFSFDEAVAVARRVGARETRFVHLTHAVSHADAEAMLPDGVAPGYDGLVLTAGGMHETGIR